MSVKDKAEAMKLLSVGGAFSGPIKWPEGAVSLKVWGSGLPTEGITITRKETERARVVEAGAYVLQEVSVAVEVGGFGMRWRYGP